MMPIIRFKEITLVVVIAATAGALAQGVDGSLRGEVRDKATGYVVPAEAGFSVELAHSGEVGLKRSLSAEHTLVVLEAALPGLNGLDVLRRIRTDRVACSGVDVDKTSRGSGSHYGIGDWRRQLSDQASQPPGVAGVDSSDSAPRKTRLGTGIRYGRCPGCRRWSPSTSLPAL